MLFNKKFLEETFAIMRIIQVKGIQNLLIAYVILNDQLFNLVSAVKLRFCSFNSHIQLLLNFQSNLNYSQNTS